MNREERLQLAIKTAERVLWKCVHEKPVLGRFGPGPCTPTPVDLLLVEWKKEMVHILLEFERECQL